jgi:hypothetical protein
MLPFESMACSQLVLLPPLRPHRSLPSRLHSSPVGPFPFPKVGPSKTTEREAFGTRLKCHRRNVREQFASEVYRLRDLSISRRKFILFNDPLFIQLPNDGQFSIAECLMPTSSPVRSFFYGEEQSEQLGIPCQ